jgi:hypothetical protein
LNQFDLAIGSRGHGYPYCCVETVLQFYPPIVRLRRGRRTIKIPALPCLKQLLPIP